MKASVEGEYDQTLILLLPINRKPMKPRKNDVDFLALYKLFNKCICKFSETLPRKLTKIPRFLI